MKRSFGCLAAAIAALVLVAVVVGVLAVGRYNALVSQDQTVEAQWAQVENAYQRRADLIPNLVKTVRGSADFERETLEAVVEARAKVGQMTVDSKVLEDPGAFRQFEAAQGELSSALSRLMVVVERYPELRTTQAFRDLMVQLEGSENRIAVERRRFNEVARDFNTTLRSFPTNVIAGVLGWDFEPKPYFESRPGADVVPEVDFG